MPISANRQEKLAIKAENGNERAIAKLAKRGITYYNVTVTYKYTIGNSPSNTLASGANWVNEDPQGRELVFNAVLYSDLNRDMPMELVGQILGLFN